jgi:hypothetical protein
VEWLQEAVNDLAAIWTRADSAQRSAITEATNRVDQELQTQPIHSSESREGEQRVLFIYPLGIRFEVDLQTRTVWVTHVWQFRRRGE